jgi:hypothetical protein
MVRSGLGREEAGDRTIRFSKIDCARVESAPYLALPRYAQRRCLGS